MHSMVLVIGNDYEKLLQPHAMKDEQGKVREHGKYEKWKKGGLFSGFLTGDSPTNDKLDLETRKKMKWAEHKDQLTVQEFLQTAEKDNNFFKHYFTGFVDQKGWTANITWNKEKWKFIEDENFEQQFKQALSQADPQTLVTLIDCESNFPE